ncbi:hypothetical protein [Luteitalea sp.]|jgi:hypothetical protein|uniref:hypothetical protein n=1 Tax=Luteitalea sp. TaxID=2004800 RepID=UPI0037C777E7
MTFQQLSVPVSDVSGGDALPADPYDDVLAGAAALRRQSLINVERDGDARRLLFRGADHVEVRRWIDQEQSLVGLLRFGDVRRAISGALCVSVAPAAPARAALELLTELSGE